MNYLLFIELLLIISKVERGSIKMKTVIIGTLAHVDAGKTTLSESLLYTCGNIKSLGRVDHGNAFLDFNTQERDRGITIFTKQAIMKWKDSELTLLDTPGHVDFSSEMERTLQVLDYAILLISGLDGIQAHSETIWKLLKHYQIPTFIFVNKMDISHSSKQQLMLKIKERFDDRCIDFTQTDEQLFEPIALTSDERLDYFLHHQSLSQDMIIEAIHHREVFPCYFGSALKLDGIESFLNGLSQYTMNKVYPSEFGAKIFKITRDENGNRLTHVKVTGGNLKVKTLIAENEKIDQIRMYSGHKFVAVNEVNAGSVCALKGLRNLQAGVGFGIEEHGQVPILSSFMNYRILLPSGCDPFSMLKNLNQLAEEDPQLRISYNEHKSEIRLQVMGEIQIEILKNIIKERFHVDVEFDQGSINYKETIENTVEGIGHFEPLRHYAEVHLLLEPAPRGSGLSFYSTCSEDLLDRNFQRLILTHLEEKEHIGVISGSPITDIKITLLGGKAHLTHSEGGDFRQATYRAIRHGLKCAKSVLLEPYYQFTLEVPSQHISKAIYDIELMNGTYQMEPSSNEYAIISGSAPVSKMQHYPTLLQSYTKGLGRISCALKGYEPCVNAVDIDYDSEGDIDNPTGSIFCEHGAGFYVPWDEVEQHMHIKHLWVNKDKDKPKTSRDIKTHIDDKELERVFTSIYGHKKRYVLKEKNGKVENQTTSITTSTAEYLLVDGYNMIYSWDDLKEIATTTSIEAARLKLIDILCNYQGYKKCTLILVFDAYKVKENLGSMSKKDNIFVVYTKSKQTADAYIEQVTHELGNTYRVVVATSDAMEQLIVLSQGARRISAREFKIEMEQIHSKTLNEYEKTQPRFRNHAMESIRTLHKK